MATPMTAVEMARALLQTSQLRLLELDALPVDQQLTATFTLGTLTVGFDAYKAYHQGIVEAYTDPGKAIVQTLGGPFEVTSTVRG